MSHSSYMDQARMDQARHPARTILGLIIAAAFSLYAALDFYGEQTDRNKTMQDPYKIGMQDQRFEALKRELPPGETLGYVSDVESNPGLVLAAQYGLAPILLVEKPAHGWVVGNFSKRLNYREFGIVRGLTVVKEFPEGVVLFRKSNQ